MAPDCGSVGFASPETTGRTRSRSGIASRQCSPVADGRLHSPETPLCCCLARAQAFFFTRRCPRKPSPILLARSPWGAACSKPHWWRAAASYRRPMAAPNPTSWDSAARRTARRRRRRLTRRCVWPRVPVIRRLGARTSLHPRTLPCICVPRCRRQEQEAAADRRQAGCLRPLMPIHTHADLAPVHCGRHLHPDAARDQAQGHRV